MSNRVINGKQFNQKYQQNKFVKLTNEKENHHNYQFQTGSNVDSITFNPQGNCQPGGIYFCEISKLSLWLHYNPEIGPMVFVRWVTIPNDAQIYIESDKFKADKIILGDRQQIADLQEWADPVYCSAAVRLNSHALQYVKEQTPELCLKAVKHDGCALKYVKEQTPEVCLEAVKNNGPALQFVKQQTHEVCLEAVKQYGFALQYVLEQTPEVCLAAVKQNGRASQFVK